MDKQLFIYLLEWRSPFRRACPVTPRLLLVSLQEVHDLLSDYELKYCFVDKYKGTGLWAMGGQGNYDRTVPSADRTWLSICSELWVLYCVSGNRSFFCPCLNFFEAGTPRKLG